jgi:hypothetical protein
MRVRERRVRERETGTRKNPRRAKEKPRRTIGGFVFFNAPD